MAFVTSWGNGLLNYATTLVSSTFVDFCCVAFAIKFILARYKQKVTGLILEIP